MHQGVENRLQDLGLLQARFVTRQVKRAIEGDFVGSILDREFADGEGICLIGEGLKLLHRLFPNSEMASRMPLTKSSPGAILRSPGSVVGWRGLLEDGRLILGRSRICSTVGVG